MYKTVQEELLLNIIKKVFNTKCSPEQYEINTYFKKFRQFFGMQCSKAGSILLVEAGSQARLALTTLEMARCNQCIETMDCA